MPEAPFRPLIVHERGSIAHVLAERRQALGLTGEELDDIAGFSDRYTAKLETPAAPQGRFGLHFDFPSEFLPGGRVRCSGMGEIWLQTLGVRLVLVDASTAEAIGAVPAPLRPPRPEGSSQHAIRRQKRGKPAAMSASQYEALDRTLVAKEAFRAAIIDHPFVDADATLKAEAAAIEEAMAALYKRIGCAS